VVTNLEAGMSSVCCFSAFFRRNSERRHVPVAFEDLVDARLCEESCGSCGSGHGVGSWSNGSPERHRLRDGPDYRRNRQKRTPGPALYRCVAMDVVESSTKIRCATSHLASKPSSGAWCCPLPRIIVVNFQAPFERGPVYGEHPSEDHGSSVLIFYEIEPCTEQMARHLSTASPAVRHLVRYFQGEHPLREGNMVSGCLKAVGVVTNAGDLDFPSVLRPVIQKFNGKPVLVEKESRHYPSLDGELVELTVDIRGFNYVARSSLYALRDQLPSIDIQVGLLVQGCTDEELPEALLGAVRFVGLDLRHGLCESMRVRAEEQTLAPMSKVLESPTMGDTVLKSPTMCTAVAPWCRPCRRRWKGFVK